MKVCINKLRLFGHHGLKKSEKENGQYFDFYIELRPTNKHIGICDLIEDDAVPIIDYENVIVDVQSVFAKKRYNLLESLIYDLEELLKKKYILSYLKIKITKADAPIEYDCKSVSVEYEWKNDE